MCCNWDRTQEDSGSVFLYACVEKGDGVTDSVCFHVLPRDMLRFLDSLHFTDDKMSWWYCDCFYQKKDTGVAWLKVWLQDSKWKTAGKARHREPVHHVIHGNNWAKQDTVLKSVMVGTPSHATLSKSSPAIIPQIQPHQRPPSSSPCTLLRLVWRAGDLIACAHSLGNAWDLLY